ncbi:MAG: bifunctional diaminohydroxyphosphoribosylaminopyrimidine deaminase/5-amino-6-(5-phosphoribosylamino)uracil reductase RibD [Peptococcaceae bacterium]|nr:bifunctional diaminohydroxyphosphoribosylaminopyrimidine deaminase/5-amino-6-(5-phosphoribosylamino)uracil reductase RibD [Peptococcaceae bacterium]
MQRALDLSLLAAGRTSPNPLVGCVIVKNGEIVGEGYHLQAGTPHAEIHALKAAGQKAQGADVYVTLEPCSHYGRTPPCTDALIKAGVKRVCIALTDPNPLVNGQGLKKLQEAGITVEAGILKDKAQKINEAFIKAVTQKMPFVLYKCALTLDGKTAVASGDSKWISSPEARQYVHHLRNTYDVIMVGSRTVIQDNPLLTCRHVEGGKNPVRLIVDATLSLPLDSKVLNPQHGLCIIAASQAADPKKQERLKAMPNVKVWQYDTERYVPLRLLLRDIAAHGWNSILLEGGGTLAGKMLTEKLIDKIEFFIAPKIAGDGPSPISGLKLSQMSEAVQLDNLEISEIGGNYKITGYVNNTKDTFSGSD